MSQKLKILSLIICSTFVHSSNIPRDSICLIRNRLFPESGFLYPESDNYNADVSRRNIFAEIFNPISGYAPKCLPSNDNCKWQFEVDKGHQSSYKLKSVHYDEYLYSAADNFNKDEQRRRSFTWIGTPCDDLECYWRIEQVPLTNFYTIKNDRYEDHLYGAADDLKFDENRRSVFGWKWNGDAGVNNDEASHWTITC